MKNIIRKILHDKVFLLSLTMVLVSMIVAISILAFNIKEFNRSVYIRYSDFGLAKQSFTGPWYYLLYFIVFQVIVGLGHSLIAIRLYRDNKKNLSIVFLAITILVLIIALILSLSVITKIAYL